MTLQEYVVKFRTEHGITQRQFAKMCDISSGYMSMIENNLNPKTGKPPTLTFPTIKKLAAAMGTSVHELAGDIDGQTWSTVDEAILSEDERDLIMYYRDMTISKKHLLLALAREFEK